MDCLGKIYAILEDLDNSCMIITSDFNANISKSDSFKGGGRVEGVFLGHYFNFC